MSPPCHVHRWAQWPEFEVLTSWHTAKYAREILLILGGDDSPSVKLATTGISDSDWAVRARRFTDNKHRRLSNITKAWHCFSEKKKIMTVRSELISFLLNTFPVSVANSKNYFIRESRAALSLRIISIDTQILALKLWSYIRVCTSNSNIKGTSYLPPRTLQAMTFHSRSFPSIDWLDGVLRNKLSDDDTLVMVLWWGDWTEEPLDDPDIWRTKYSNIRLSNIDWNTISLFEDWKPCLIHYGKNTIGTYINLNG